MGMPSAPATSSGTTRATRGRCARNAAASAKSASSSSEITVGGSIRTFPAVSDQQVTGPNPRAVVGLGRGAPRLLVGGHAGSEDPRVVPARLELGSHPVGPTPQVGHGDHDPTLLLDLAHRGSSERGRDVGRDTRMTAARSASPGVAGSNAWSTGSTPPPGSSTIEGANAIDATRRYVDLRASRTVAHEHHGGRQPRNRNRALRSRQPRLRPRSRPGVA